MPCVKMCDRSLHNKNSLIQVDLCVQVLASGMSLVLAIANLSYATGKFHKTNDYLMFACNLTDLLNIFESSMCFVFVLQYFISALHMITNIMLFNH